MPEFKKPEPPKPPQVLCVVPAAEFIKAVKGEPFAADKGLYRLKGKEINQKKLFRGAYFFLNDENEYVILQQANVTGAESLDFLNIELTNYKIGLIFYKSILPGITLQNTITGDWHLFNSFIKGDIRIGKNSQSGDIRISSNSQSENIWISKNSQSGYIMIYENSQSGGIMIHENSQSGDIRILENSQSGNISIRKNSRSGYISILENSQAADIGISENSQSGFISIRENSQNGYISIRKNSQSGYIWIRANSQSGDIRILENSQAADIWIRANSQSGNIRIRANSQSRNIWISVNSESGDISISKNSQTGNIEIENSSCSGLDVSDNYTSLKLFNAVIPLMKFNNCCIHELNWQAGTKGELYISHCKINHLNLTHTSLLNGALLSITNSELLIVQLNKLTVQGQLLLTNLRHLTEPFNWEPGLKKIQAEKKPADATELENKFYQSKISLLEEQEKKYYEEKEKLLTNVSKEPLWRMANSSLGKTEITGCDLTGFTFEYRDSKLLDAFISGTKLPKEKIDIYNPEPGNKLNDVDYFEQKISIYNQLKKIFDNQGNIVEATWYHSKAMDNQQRLLQLKYTQAKKKWFSDEGFDLFNFKINKWSNNHGESWRKGLWFVLLTSLVIYIIYYISLNYKESFSFKATGRFIGNFFSFLNIARRDDFMGGNEKLTGLSLFLSFLGRVVTGFGIYQLIAAFRRHGRK